jgi:hypothetical protein
MESAQRNWFFYILLFFLLIIGMALFIKEKAMLANIEAERDANYAFLGQAKAMYAEERAKSVYDRWFVQSGVMQASFDTFIPTTQQANQSAGLEDLGHQVFPWFETRIRAWWTLVYHFFVRTSTALVWWPLLVLTGVPFIIDAFVVRAVKASSFGITSPHFQGLSMRMIPAIVIGYFLLMFAPFVLHPALVPIAIFITSGLSWVIISQFVKRG